MYAGQKFSFPVFLYWTRRDLYRGLLLAAVPTGLYHWLGFTFLALSWVPVASLGTAVSLLIGFKNNATYGRLLDARQAYGGIASASRTFGVLVRDFLGPADPAAVEIFYTRHFAWLTALRYQLRESRTWENMTSPANAEYARHYVISEKTVPLAQELARYLPAGQLPSLLLKHNRAAQLIAEQSRHLNSLRGTVGETQLLQLQAAIAAFADLQGRVESVKNFPYPRNFSSATTILLGIFVLLVPLGMLGEFNSLGKGTFLAPYSIWFNIPFSALLIWVFVSLERVGESSANPFEGSANDVPISEISHAIEIDLREMVGEINLPEALVPMGNVLL